ncbi:MAG: hypothetical protein J6Y78_04420 [Paludibacteraceae bacterium]|nr:hypothetical protein [Paludibacteraceae bacterium]
MSKKSSQYLKFLVNSSEETVKGYKQSLKKYEEFHSMSIDDLVCEALDEQARLVPPHMLKIIERLEDFQLFLIEQGYVARTVSIHMNRVKATYKKNRVVLPYIEPLNTKKVLKKEYIEFKDILTKDELKKAIPQMRLPAQARAMVMIQGGLSNEECEHLTTRSFLDELKQYHRRESDLEALRWLSDENHPVIWITKLIRVKTGKPYYAIIGAEAVNKIAQAKLYEMELPKNKGEIPRKLLSQHKISFTHSCEDVNEKCGFGYISQVTYSNVADEDGDIYIRKSLFKHFVMLSDIPYKLIKQDNSVVIHTEYPHTEVQYKLNGECKFSPHKLRKFHGTHIRGSVLTPSERVSISEIDEMQGRGKTNTQDTYIKTNPLEQKLLYAKIMNNVSLWHQYDYEVTNDDVIVTLKNPHKMSEEIVDLKKKLQKNKNAFAKVDALRKELGDEVFIELFNEILNTS